MRIFPFVLNWFPQAAITNGSLTLEGWKVTHVTHLFMCTYDINMTLEAVPSHIMRLWHTSWISYACLCLLTLRKQFHQSPMTWVPTRRQCSPASGSLSSHWDEIRDKETKSCRIIVMMDVYVLGNNQIKNSIYGNLRCESSGNGEQNHLLVGGEILNVDLVRWRVLEEVNWWNLIAFLNDLR